MRLDHLLSKERMQFEQSCVSSKVRLAKMFTRCLIYEVYLIKYGETKQQSEKRGVDFGNLGV